MVAKRISWWGQLVAAGGSWWELVGAGEISGVRERSDAVGTGGRLD